MFNFSWNRINGIIIHQLFILILLLIPFSGLADVECQYITSKGSVNLNVSQRFIAVSVNDEATIQSRFGLVRDPISERSEFQRTSYVVMRWPDTQKTSLITMTSILDALLFSGLQTNCQPVYEQGPTLLIPSDGIIVGFNSPKDLKGAKKSSLLNLAGVHVERHLRKNVFIVRLDEFALGRALAVSREISRLPEVAFAEPDFIQVMNYTEELAIPEAFTKSDSKVIWVDHPLEQAVLKDQPVENRSYPVWTTLASIDFEDIIFPPAGWSRGYEEEAQWAYWGKTNYRSHSGSSSLYCAQDGTYGVAAPGPPPSYMSGVFTAPYFDLSSYEEVYFEFWFYAINEVAGSENPADGGVLRITNNLNEHQYIVMAVSYSNDCTTDPTTENGWRRVLIRVSPEFRTPFAQFQFRYISDVHTNFQEGVYLDDIRIVACANVDTEMIGTDTYAGRLQGDRNVGQVANLGNLNNDMQVAEAWATQTVSSSVTVAVIDQGVDLSHPDLNLVTGYDPDGSVGGSARGDHGTACAGEAGAIRNNGFGVAGTAPNVKIMPLWSGENLSDLIAAIDLGVIHGANILSCSWGYNDTYFDSLAETVLDALDQNVTVIAASGNGPDRSPWDYNTIFPGTMSADCDLICVGASSLTDEHKSASSSDGKFYWGSSYVGCSPDVCAPGVWSYTTDRTGADGYNDGSAIDPGDLASADYDHDFGGTSSSTPKVAGIVALMLSRNPDLSPGEIKSILRSTADDIGDPGVDEKTGAGRVNAYNAVLAAGAVPAMVDIGLRLFDGYQNIKVACEPAGTLTSPLRIHKNGVTYGVILVDPSHDRASGLKVQTSGGLKAVRKF